MVRASKEYIEGIECPCCCREGWVLAHEEFLQRYTDPDGSVHDIFYQCYRCDICDCLFDYDLSQYEDYCSDDDDDDL